MGRQALAKNIEEKIKELAPTMTKIDVAKKLKISRATVSRVLSGKEPKRIYPSGINELRRQEAKILIPGCLNVYDFGDWIAG